MNCKKCGNLLNVNEKFCPNCGEPVVNGVENQNNNLEQPAASSFVQPMQTQPVQQPNDMNNMSFNNAQSEQPMQQNLNNDFNQSLNNQNTMNQNVQNMQTQPTNNYNMNQNNTSNTPTQNNKNFKIIVAVLIVVVIGIVVFIVSKSMSKKDNSNSNSTSNETNTNQVVNTVDSNTGNTYTYKNFQFSIPSGYDASEVEGVLTLKSQNANVAFAIIDYYTLDDVTASIDSVKSTYTSSGFTIKSEDKKTFNGKEWLLLPSTITKNGQTLDLTIAYTDLGQYHLIEALVATATSDDTVYTELSKMFNTATYNGSSSFSQNGEKEKFNPTIKFNESLTKFGE